MTKEITPELEKKLLAKAEAALKASPSDIKVRITTMVDQDVLEALKGQARESNQKYQTLLNAILRKAVLGEDDVKVAKVLYVDKETLRSDVVSRDEFNQLLGEMSAIKEMIKR